MSLKTRLRIWIVALVAIVVVSISVMYIYDFTSLAFEAAHKRARLVAEQLRDYVIERVRLESEAQGVRPASLADSKRLWTSIVRTDPRIRAMLDKTLVNADVVVELHITDETGAALVGTSPHAVSASARSLSFDEVQSRNAFANFWDLFNKAENYTEDIPLGVAGQLPIMRIVVVIRSSLLRDSLAPALRNLALAFLLSLPVAMALGFVLPGIVLSPLERLSRRIDRLSAGEFEAGPFAQPPETQEFAAVESKLSLLGQQFQGAKQDVTQLRGNIEELLQRLEEAVLLVDSSRRVMIVGRSAERMLGQRKSELIGKRVEEVFPVHTVLGAFISEVLNRKESALDRIVFFEGPGARRTRLCVSIEILQNGSSDKDVSAMITLRDAETRRQIERQLDLSTRLAAIGRLTSGVAHEIKNPLNAMALHLEVLKSKLESDDPEIAVISKEIKRLDNVVKTFLNFSKPVELQTQPLNASALVSELVDLIAPEAHAKGVQVNTELADSHWINGDPNLLKQAILNVLVNGVDATQSGGTLTVKTFEIPAGCTIEISDTGHGIPPEARDKIFNLYFSTKANGSGIGLAMTFRLVQLHGGSIDFSSAPDTGTSFRLLFPSLSGQDEGHSVSAHS